MNEVCRELAERATLQACKRFDALRMSKLVSEGNNVLRPRSTARRCWRKASPDHGLPTTDHGPLTSDFCPLTSGNCPLSSALDFY